MVAGFLPRPSPPPCSGPQYSWGMFLQLQSCVKHVNKKIAKRGVLICRQYFRGFHDVYKNFVKKSFTNHNYLFSNYSITLKSVSMVDDSGNYRQVLTADIYIYIYVHPKCFQEEIQLASQGSFQSFRYFREEQLDNIRSMLGKALSQTVATHAMTGSEKSFQKTSVPVLPI